MLGIIAYTMLAGGLLIALWKKPSAALGGVLCMFGLEQWGQATTQFFVSYPTFTNFLIGVFVVAALFVKHIRDHYILSGYPFVGWIVVGLFLYSLASVIWSPRPDMSFYLWLSQGPYIITIVILTPFLISQIRDVQIGLSGLNETKKVLWF